MFLRYTFDSPMARDEEHGFIRHYDVDVFGFGEDGEHLIGKVAFDVFLWGDAEAAGANLFDICDADSQGWYDVFCALSGTETIRDGGRDEILPELGIEDVVDRITFIWRFLLHPEARSSYTKGGSQLIFRDLHLQVPYDARHPRGEEVDFEARPEHGKWILKEWEKQ